LIACRFDPSYTDYNDLLFIALSVGGESLMALYDSLYPYFGVTSLRDQHGYKWAEIVDYVRGQNAADPHVMAFTLTLRRIRKQHNLSTSLCKDPFCAVCASDVLKHYPGSEEELIHLYFKNLHEMQHTVKMLRSSNTLLAAQAKKTNVA
jgi:hypothetical protein